MKFGNASVWNNSTRIPELYGVLIALGLIVYFFAMYLVGFIHIVELRLLNLLILAAGVYFALRQYRRTHGGRMDYFHSFTVGMGASSIGTGLFAVFLFLYMQVDRHLMQSLTENEPLGMYLNPYIAAFIVSLEGLFSGMFVTFLLSNFMAERRRVRKPRQTEIIQ